MTGLHPDGRCSSRGIKPFRGARSELTQLKSVREIGVRTLGPRPRPGIGTPTTRHKVVLYGKTAYRTVRLDLRDSVRDLDLINIVLVVVEVDGRVGVWGSGRGGGVALEVSGSTTCGPSPGCRLCCTGHW